MGEGIRRSSSEGEGIGREGEAAPGRQAASRLSAGKGAHQGRTSKRNALIGAIPKKSCFSKFY